jgi:hypothetical protein
MEINALRPAWILVSRLLIAALPSARKSQASRSRTKGEERAASYMHKASTTHPDCWPPIFFLLSASRVAMMNY